MGYQKTREVILNIMSKKALKARVRFLEAELARLSQDQDSNTTR